MSKAIEEIPPKNIVYRTFYADDTKVQLIHNRTDHNIYARVVWYDRSLSPMNPNLEPNPLQTFKPDASGRVILYAGQRLDYAVEGIITFEEMDRRYREAEEKGHPFHVLEVTF